MTSLPLGAVLFATTGGEAAPSLPSTVADGDLDGDLYLALWDKVRLPHRALPLPLSISLYLWTSLLSTSRCGTR